MTPSAHLLAPLTAADVGAELGLANLGNKARTARGQWFGTQWFKKPAAPFSAMGGSSGGRQALYKFLESPFVHYDELVESHALGTYGRMAQAQDALVLHDTTEFGSARAKELGRLRGSKQGLLAHVSFAVGVGEGHLPLGTLGMRAWSRDQGPPRNRTAKGRQLSGAECSKLPDRETDRWWDAVDEIGARVADKSRVVHVMDREGDSYALLSKMVEGDHRFVVRMARDRVACGEVAVGERDRVASLTSVAPKVVDRDVVLSSRRKSSIPGLAKTFGERDQRRAKLQIRATSMLLGRPNYLKDPYPEWLPINVVHVVEVDPVDGVDPVEWTLATTLPIATPMDVEQIVDIYRARWIIEELFKALKTGCALGERMLESFETICNAIAVALPVAWSMLRLRSLAHHGPRSPATDVLTPTQIKILQSRGHLTSRSPTARDALYAVAALGGYVPPAKDRRPGWQVIGRGFIDLLRLEEGWLAAFASLGKKLDHS
jgi:hypothetical protein